MEMSSSKVYENKAEGVNVCVIRTNIGRKFKGIARCYKEDMKYYSSILGGSIATCIAQKKFYAALIKDLKRLLKSTDAVATPAFKEACRQKLRKAEMCYEEICKEMPIMIEDYFKAKAKVKSYLKRKEKGLPTTMVEDLQIKADELRKMAKKRK